MENSKLGRVDFPASGTLAHRIVKHGVDIRASNQKAEDIISIRQLRRPLSTRVELAENSGDEIPRLVLTLDQRECSPDPDPVPVLRPGFSFTMIALISVGERNNLVVEVTMTRPRYRIVHRADDSEVENAVELARERIADSIRVLQTSEPPDTFLGRRHCNLIPAPDHDMRRHHRH